MGIHFKVVVASIFAVLFYLAVPPTMRIPAEAAVCLESFIAVVGGIYSVLSAFAIFACWEQFKALEKFTVREGSLSSEVPRLAALLGERTSDFRYRIATATRAYLEAGAAEWEDLANGLESSNAADALNALEARVREAGAVANESNLIYVRMVDALGALRECRSERLAIASHRMPQTLTHLLLLLSTLLLAAFLALPTGELWIGAAIFASLSGVLAMIHAVVWDLNHPFVGVWNVSKAPFEERAKALPR